MRIKQALKYSEAQRVLDGAFSLSDQGKHEFWNPTFYRVYADALEEEGKEGLADLMREKAKHLEEDRDTWISGGTYNDGPIIHYPSGTGGVFGSVAIIGPPRDGSPANQRPNTLRPEHAKSDIHQVHVSLSAGSGDGKSHRSGLGMMLTPEEAKAATARLPNAAEIHQFIDSHFNAPTETQ